jgi:hypothetical protein
VAGTHNRENISELLLLRSARIQSASKELQSAIIRNGGRAYS